VDNAKFFKALGRRIRELRHQHHHSQEDMISFGFSARHWQQIEAGRPITVTTLLRICEVFEVRLEEVVRGLDRGIYR
jgi:transcriptional regulator with XRE-family HTH domain